MLRNDQFEFEFEDQITQTSEENVSERMLSEGTLKRPK